MGRAQLQRDDVTDSMPLRLDIAARLAFPDGSIGLSSLRREAAKGNLEVWRIAGKDMTTLAAIREMMDKCLVKRSPPASGSDRPQRTEKPSGSSSTEESRLAQAALNMTLRGLKESLKNTSPPSASLRKSKAPVIPLKSR